MATARAAGSGPRDHLRQVLAVEILHRDVEVAGLGRRARRPRARRRSPAELLLQLRAHCSASRMSCASRSVPSARACSATWRPVRVSRGQEHDGHAAAADLLEDLVRAEPVEDALASSRLPSAAAGARPAGPGSRRREKPVLRERPRRQVVQRTANTSGSTPVKHVAARSTGGRPASTITGAVTRSDTPLRANALWAIAARRRTRIDERRAGVVVDVAADERRPSAPPEKSTRARWRPRSRRPRSTR